MNPTLDVDSTLERLAADPSRVGIFSDFDGTLSEIVDHPDAAVPVEDAGEVLERLAEVFGVVGLISGRSLDDLRSRFAPAGVLLAGAYGREKSDRPPAFATRDWLPITDAATTAIHGWDGVVVERKGAGVALHYRLAPERGDDVRAAAAALAERFGLELRPGRMVAELTEPGPGKAEALATLLDEHGVSAFLFAGDDVADGEVFAWARGSHMPRMLVGVRSAESPRIIEENADVVVDGPRELVKLLARLAAIVRRRG